MRAELESILQKKPKSPLKERIGHTPIEVAWWIIFGSVLTYILYYMFFIVVK
jgi:acid phosphatase family membrane protein YuiD